jgi:ABC-type amino acid transport substrate-binding protein
MMRLLSGLAVTLMLLTPATFSLADDEQRPLLRVGTKHAPPFAMRAADSDWFGLSIDLWERLARQLEVDYELVGFPDNAQLLQAVNDGGVDCAVAAITMTAEREEAIDFSHSYYSTGLGIAVLPEHRYPWLVVVQKLLAPAFLKVVASLSLLLLLVGTLIWLVERRSNEQFGGTATQGIGAGFWWSAVTMTTVGYGDKAPVSIAGRLLAVVWMFVAIIIISSFTAAITASLTVSQLESGIESPRDLPGVRVGTVADSASSVELERRGVACQTFPSIEAVLDSLVDRQLDAAVYDMPILKYQVLNRYAKRLIILPMTFQRQDYAFALASGDPMRERLNRALLAEITAPWWRENVEHYLGQED